MYILLLAEGIYVYYMCPLTYCILCISLICMCVCVCVRVRPNASSTSLDGDGGIGGPLKAKPMIKTVRCIQPHTLLFHSSSCHGAA